MDTNTLPLANTKYVRQVHLHRRLPFWFSDSSPDPDDTLLGHYMIATWAKTCQVVGPEFEPYLPVVMPHLLAAVSCHGRCIRIWCVLRTFARHMVLSTLQMIAMRRRRSGWAERRSLRMGRPSVVPQPSRRSVKHSRRWLSIALWYKLGAIHLPEFRTLRVVPLYTVINYTY